MSAVVHEFKPEVPAGIDETGWLPVCPMDELIPYVGTRALLGKRQIALFRVAPDRVYAIGAYDPFSDAAVLSRGIVGDVQGQLVVASPIYKHHFNLKTGRCLEKPSVGVPTYKTRIVDGQLQVLSVPV